MSFRRGFEEFSSADAFQNKANFLLKANCGKAQFVQKQDERLDEESLTSLGLVTCEL